ncbi:MAG TPA: hypothetical protein VHM31_24755 [Polyangia bacterium]|nr:hypothetical protein [Polyangia bacterium]
MALLCAGTGCLETDRVLAVQLDAFPAFSAPTLVPGLRADSIDVHDPSLTADELEIYLSSDTDAVSDIWTSTRTSAGGAWAPAVLQADLSSPGNDADPDVSPDGLTIYFASDRAGDGYRLYVSRRAARGQPWGPPQQMTGLGASTLDAGPSVDPGGLQMVFASQRSSNDVRLYRASRTDPQGGWSEVTPLDEINSTRQDENPALFDHALSLIWSSRGPSNGATSDLLEVSRPSTSAPFSTAPMALDALNSAADWDGDPWLSQDGHHIVFVSDRTTGVSQLYEAWR